MDAKLDEKLADWLALLWMPVRERNTHLQHWLQHGEFPARPSANMRRSEVQATRNWLASDRAHHCIALPDPRYPALLREIDCPPPVLFARGEPATMAGCAVAMVGARKATAGGLENARHLAAELARRGVAVVSGLALGIDGAAHQGALFAGGKTLAVLGSGPDRIYPSRHEELAARVQRQGVLLSEFLPGTAPRKENFPRRNRIISGMCTVTVVVEAGLRSGSLVTARLALAQGREVAAVPGALQNAMAAGSNQLLKDGAAVITDANDILDMLPADLLTNLPVQSADVEEAQPSPDEEHPLWRALESFPISLDQLAARAGWSAARTAAMLSQWELEGRICREAGGYCRACRERL